MSSVLVVSNRLTLNTEYFPTPFDLYDYLHGHPEVKTLVFVFWSWIVPEAYLKTYECYGFHTGPLLEGRGKGGDPIGNLQRLGVSITTLCAFKMTEKIDGGKVKVAIPVSIDGTKDEVVDRIDKLVTGVVTYLTCPQPEIPEVFTRASATPR